MSQQSAVTDSVPAGRTGPPSGPLDAAETADAAVTAALVVALLAAGRVLAAGSAMQVVASFVVAVLAARRRSRTVVIATAAAAAIALILGGLGPVSQATLAGVFGWCGGQGLKRGWGRTRSVVFTLAIAWPAMAASVMFFYPAVAINRKLRELVFENVENQASGMGNILGGIGGLFDSIGLGVVGSGFDAVGTGLQDLAGFLIDNWVLLIPATELVYSFVYALVIRAVSGGVLRRLERALTDPIAADLAPAEAEPAPVPVRVDGQTLRRNGVEVTSEMSLVIDPGEHVVITGPNGAGKSTLLDALAGLDNTAAVDRPGPVGLGRFAGTARVGQRPEAQVVGTTAEEDLRWGLPDDRALDVVARLAAVGLTVPPDRPTSELSGGELQRLALASALERRPALLLADEVTSMLDPEEQRRIIARLDQLTDTTVVRTTHRNDAAVSDRHIAITPRIRTPRIRTPRDSGPHGHPQSDRPRQAPLHKIDTSIEGTRLIQFRDVGFAHNSDQPWAHPVLEGINLSIHRYEMVVIEGRNGSGKTTLARLLAGITRPTTGTVLRTSGVQRALAHQHVRLQLLKPSVDLELRSLAGVATEAAADRVAKTRDGASDAAKRRAREANLSVAIDLFDLESLIDRRIDELSGGEQRRVLLAGLVARGVSLLVLDEPLAGLDAAGRADLAETLDHVRLAGTSVVVVSHDVDWEPLQVSQRLRLDNGRLSEVRR